MKCIEEGESMDLKWVIVGPLHQQTMEEWKDFIEQWKRKTNIFRNQDVPEAKIHLISWISDYNWKRYHSAIGCSPSEKGKRLQKEVFIK